MTDSIAMREELRRRATHDELTGCLNRAAITRALEQSIDDGEPGAQRALLFIDLDGFKEVNDDHGHAAGDELLRAVAGHLRASVRAGDLVGRLGGDEFLVLCPDMDELEARRLADRLAVSAAAGAVAHAAEVEGQRRCVLVARLGRSTPRRSSRGPTARCTTSSASARTGAARRPAASERPGRAGGGRARPAGPADFSEAPPCGGAAFRPAGARTGRP